MVVTDEKFKGRVLWYNDALGIGMLSEDLSGQHYFIDHSQVMTVDKTVEEEDLVSFIPRSNYAFDITLIL